MAIIKNSLGFDSNLEVWQDKEMFSYSVDTILLGNFLSLTSKTKRILEIGANNGALAIFVAARKANLHIDAVEIQAKACALALKNVQHNKMTDQINIIHADFKDFTKLHNKEMRQKYDAIVCNPPFYKVDSSKMRNLSPEFHAATHEISITLEDAIQNASRIICQKGYLAIVHKTERLVDIVCLMRKYNFEPKRVQFVHPREDQKSNLVLVEGRFQVGWGTFFLKNIYLHHQSKDSHEYRDEVKNLYKPAKYKATKE